jgi:hypothetical protein
VYVPDDHRAEFTHASEHVTHDAAIDSLLACAESLREAAKVVRGDWEAPLGWIDARLNELWKMRGPYPGLGSALTAYGLERGNLIAYDIASGLKENEDPWPVVDCAFEQSRQLKPGLERHLSAIDRLKWQRLPEERRSLLKLLARFEINARQATRFYQRTEREQAGIAVADAELLANPYLLYELDRSSKDPIAVTIIDRGVFPDPVVREAHPLPAPSALDGATDPRRVHALVVQVLEDAAAGGDTLRPRARAIQTIRDMPISPGCPVDQDLMPIVEDAFGGVLQVVSMAGGERLINCIVWRT